MIALIDFDTLNYRGGFSVEAKLDKDNIYIPPVEVCLGRVKQSIKKLLRVANTTKYIGYLTSTDKSNFRFSVAKSKGYKANRKDLDKPYYYDIIREYLQVHYNTQVIHNMEADDAISIDANYLLSKNKDFLIMHQDKDLNQIVGKHCNFVTGVFYEINDFEGFKNFCEQCISGDRSDNIPGLRGYGESKLNSTSKGQKILRECKTKQELWKSVQETYQNHPDHKEDWKEYLTEQASLLYLLQSKGDTWNKQEKRLQRLT